MKEINEVIKRLSSKCFKGKEKDDIHKYIGISSDILAGKNYCIRTGVEFLDRILGGGIFFSKITEILGTEHCGKTALAILASHRSSHSVYLMREENVFVKVKNAKTIVIYIDNEDSLNDTNRLLVDGEKLQCVVTSCDTISHLFNIVAEFSATISNLNKPESPVFGLIVVDTIAGVCSDDEAVADLGKQDYPRGPKQLRAGFRRVSSMLRDSNVGMLCLNQVGTTMGGGKRNPFQSSVADAESFVSPGGKALKYWATTRLWMTECKDYKLRNTSRNCDGKVVEAVVLKCRFATPKRKVRLALSYGVGNKAMNEGGGFSVDLSILETLLLLKLAEYDNDTKVIRFKFKKHGIEVPESMLGKSKRITDPKINDRSEWSNYYKLNKETFDKLIDVAYDLLLSTGYNNESFNDEDDDDDLIEVPSRRKLVTRGSDLDSDDIGD